MSALVCCSFRPAATQNQRRHWGAVKQLGLWLKRLLGGCNQLSPASSPGSSRFLTSLTNTHSINAFRHICGNADTNIYAALSAYVC